MDTAKPGASREEFAVLVRHAGLTLSEAQQGSLYEVYGHLEAMVARLRGSRDGGDRARGAEPAHVFVPGQAWP